MNIPDVSIVRKYGQTLICVSCSEGSRYDQGAVWTVHDGDTGKLLLRGVSYGWDGQGSGSRIEAPKTARKRAHDYLRKFKPKTTDAQDQD